jgi:orotate phosphoribosyltransferase-like protein
MGYSTTKHNQKLSNDDLHLLREQGLSFRAIAKEVNHSASGVRWRINHGL